MSTELNSCKYRNVSVTSQLNSHSLVSQNSWEFYAFYSRWQTLICTYITCQFAHTCTIPRETYFPPSHAYSYIFGVNRLHSLILRLTGSSVLSSEFPQPSQYTPNECPGYDTKQSDWEAPFVELWEMWSNPFIVIAPKSTLARNSSTDQGPIYNSNRTDWYLNSVQINDLHKIESLEREVCLLTVC